MGSEGARPGGPSAPERLDDRILRAIEGRAGHLSFNGLRRTLGVHPESLSRALRRLERIGVLLHDAAGYSLSESQRSDLDAAAAPRVHIVGEVRLPADTSAEAVLGQFAGRWLEDLRWVGAHEGPRQSWLFWTVPGVKGQVVATVRDGRLIVGTDRSSTAETAPLEAAARSLLATGLSRWRRSVPRQDVGALEAFRIGPVVPPSFGPN